MSCSWIITEKTQVEGHLKTVDRRCNGPDFSTSNNLCEGHFELKYPEVYRRMQKGEFKVPSDEIMFQELKDDMKNHSLDKMVWVYEQIKGLFPDENKTFSVWRFEYKDNPNLEKAIEQVLKNQAKREDSRYKQPVDLDF